MIVNQQDRFASIQIIKFNPILKESPDIRLQYFTYLKRLIRSGGWDRKKYIKAQLSYYRETLCGDTNRSPASVQICFDSRFCNLLPFDLVTILGFHKRLITPDKADLLISRISSDFYLQPSQTDLLHKIFGAAMGNPVSWKYILRHKSAQGFLDYLEVVKRNVDHLRKRPFNILITATMSAGKSTLINALVGKNISRMQNMTCTSKLHKIVSKTLDDDATAAYDHALSMNASQDELLCDNLENTSPLITVGTYFFSTLAGKRIVLIDSPGVNSSQNQEHTQITHQVLQSGKYGLLLYVLNATQLGTTDEERHLKFVHQTQEGGNVIFVMNKVDQLLSDDDNLPDIIEHQKQFLSINGFANPIICPVSSRAAYLAKMKLHGGLKRLEQREMERYMDKFEQYSLSQYYEKDLNRPVCAAGNDEEALLVNCGFSYLETIIADFYETEVK